MSKRIVIIEDDESCRFLYRCHLGEIHDLEIIAEFENAEEALLQIPQLKPDVVIVDYTLPGMSGIEFAEWLHQYPEIKVLLVSGHERDFFKSTLKSSPNFKIIQKEWSDKFLENIIGFCK
jgi:DNA-binding NarL/FixJ family response regulator